MSVGLHMLQYIWEVRGQLPGDCVLSLQSFFTSSLLIGGLNSGLPITCCHLLSVSHVTGSRLLYLKTQAHGLTGPVVSLHHWRAPWLLGAAMFRNVRASSPPHSLCKSQTYLPWDLWVTLQNVSAAFRLAKLLFTSWWWLLQHGESCSRLWGKRWD